MTAVLLGWGVRVGWGGGVSVIFRSWAFVPPGFSLFPPDGAASTL